MMNLNKWLDTKKGNIIRRVYMLGLLFISNAILVIGAAMHYVHGKTIIVFVIGVIGTIVCVGILSEPINLEDQLNDN